VILQENIFKIYYQYLIYFLRAFYIRFYLFETLCKQNISQQYTLIKYNFLKEDEIFRVQLRPVRIFVQKENSGT